MKYISSDTNIWIDFNTISRTDLPFRLPCTYIMYKEALRKEIINPPELLTDLQRRGLIGVDLTIEEFFYADELSKKYVKLSGYDRTAKSATIKEEQKQGYEQVKYSWQRGEYKYLSRWHSRTPNAPKEQGDSWVVERRIPGIGNGPNAREAKAEVLVGRTPSGRNIWVDKKIWNDAIYARKHGTCTKKQKEMLDHGHWKA